MNQISFDQTQSFIFDFSKNGAIGSYNTGIQLPGDIAVYNFIAACLVAIPPSGATITVNLPALGTMAFGTGLMPGLIAGAAPPAIILSPNVANITVDITVANVLSGVFQFWFQYFTSTPQ